MRKLTGNLLLVIGAIVMAALLAEGLLRLIGYSSPVLYRADPCCGASLRPGAEGLWSREGRDYVVINSRGLRDREHSLRKPAGTLRIAVLGDSYTEALQLPMEQAWWSVLGKELERCSGTGGRQVEVINFGVSGYGTAQELLTLRHKVWAYDPDMVILGFLTGNDIRNNLRELEGDPMRPYFLLDEGQLQLDDRFLSDPGYRFRRSARYRLLAGLISHSRFLQLLNSVRQQMKARALQQQMAGMVTQEAGMPLEVGLDNLVYFPPRSEAWEKAWAVTEALIQTMAREVQARDREFLLVSLSNGAQVIPFDAQREAFRKMIGIDDLFYPDQRIAHMAEESAIPYLMLAPRLLDWAKANHTCVHGFENAGSCGGHWNRYGHQVAGKLIAGKVCGMLSTR